MASITTIEDGTWTATWGRSVILLRRDEAGWIASVWTRSTSMRVDGQTPLAQAGPFTRTLDAGEWAWDILRARGARVTLLDLAFRPVPAAAR